jgi:hypothetical protein
LQIGQWNYYNPDGIKNYTVNGTTYLVTNEGDEKDYSGFSERTVVGASDYNLDPPFIQMLGFKTIVQHGRMSYQCLEIQMLDADFEEISCLERSFEFLILQPNN